MRRYLSATERSRSFSERKLINFFLLPDFAYQESAAIISFETVSVSLLVPPLRFISGRGGLFYFLCHGD